jgi:hypothetical protein
VGRAPRGRAVVTTMLRACRATRDSKRTLRAVMRGERLAWPNLRASHPCARTCDFSSTPLRVSIGRVTRAVWADGGPTRRRFPPSAARAFFPAQMDPRLPPLFPPRWSPLPCPAALLYS